MAHNNSVLDCKILYDVVDFLDGAATANLTTLKWLVSKVKIIKQYNMYIPSLASNNEHQLTKIYASSVEERLRLASSILEMEKCEQMGLIDRQKPLNQVIELMSTLKTSGTYVSETSGVGMAQASVLPNLTVEERTRNTLYLPIDANHYLPHTKVLPVLFSCEAERPISCYIMEKLCNVIGADKNTGAIESGKLTKPTDICNRIGEWPSGPEAYKNPPVLGTESAARLSPFVDSPTIGESAKVIVKCDKWQPRFLSLDSDEINNCDWAGYEAKGEDKMKHSKFYPALWLKYAYTYCYQGDWADVGVLNHVAGPESRPVYLPVGDIMDGEQETALKIEAIMVASVLHDNQSIYEKKTKDYLSNIKIGSRAAKDMWPLVGITPSSITFLVSDMDPIGSAGRTWSILPRTQVLTSYDDQEAIAIVILNNVVQELISKNSQVSELFKRHFLSALYILSLAHMLTVHKDPKLKLKSMQKALGVVDVSIQDKLSDIVSVASSFTLVDKGLSSSTIYSRAIFCSLQALTLEVYSLAVKSEVRISRQLAIPAVPIAPWAHICNCCRSHTQTLVDYINSTAKKQELCNFGSITLDRMQATVCYKHIKSGKKIVEKYSLVSPTLDMYALLWEENFVTENKKRESVILFKGNCELRDSSIIWEWKALAKKLATIIYRKWDEFKNTAFVNAIVSEKNNVYWEKLRPSKEEATKIANATLLGCLVRNTIEVPSSSFRSTLAYITKCKKHNGIHTGRGGQTYVTAPPQDISIPTGMLTIESNNTTWFPLSSKQLVCIMRGHEDTIVIASPRYTSAHAHDIVKENRKSDLLNIFLNDDNHPDTDLLALSKKSTIRIHSALEVKWYADVVETNIKDLPDQTDFIRTMIIVDSQHKDSLKLTFDDHKRPKIRFPVTEALEWLTKERLSFKIQDNKLVIYRIASSFNLKSEINMKGSFAFFTGELSYMQDRSQNTKWERTIEKSSHLRDIIRKQSPHLDEGVASEYASILIMLSAQGMNIVAAEGSCWLNTERETAQDVVILIDLPFIIGKNVEYNYIPGRRTLQLVYKLSTRANYEVDVYPDKVSYMQVHGLPALCPTSPIKEVPVSSIAVIDFDYITSSIIGLK